MVLVQFKRLILDMEELTPNSGVLNQQKKRKEDE
jgi:hypothetical protein